MTGGNQQMNLNLDLGKMPTIECVCGSFFFKTVVMLKQVSRLAIGAEKDAIVPIQVFRCDDCGNIAVDLLPKEIQSMFRDEETDNSTKISLEP